MTKLQQAIEHIRSLPEAEQEKWAEYVLQSIQSDTDAVFEFTPEESSELDRRLRDKNAGKSIDGVFANYGL
jgi:hypothetical protein